MVECLMQVLSLNVAYIRFVGTGHLTDVQDSQDSILADVSAIWLWG